MRTRFYISALVVAVMMVVVSPFARHHHHGTRICVSVEHCVHDDADNDCHTSHHSPHGDAQCVEKADVAVHRYDDAPVHADVSVGLPAADVAVPEMCAVLTCVLLPSHIATALCAGNAGCDGCRAPPV